MKRLSSTRIRLFRADIIALLNKQGLGVPKDAIVLFDPEITNATEDLDSLDELQDLAWKGVPSGLHDAGVPNTLLVDWSGRVNDESMIPDEKLGE